MNKIYRLYIYIDPDGDFYFNKKDNWYHENTLELFFKTRENAGKRMYETLNDIYSTLSETTPDYFKKLFEYQLKRCKAFFLETDLNVFINEETGNYTFDWCLEEIYESSITLEDTKEKLNIYKVENS